MRLTKKEELHNALCVILEEAKRFTEDDNNPPTVYITKEHGICDAVLNYFSGRVWFRDRIANTFLTWSGFSGNTTFPVGGQREYQETANLWIGESGEKRRSLLNHMISEFSK